MPKFSQNFLANPELSRAIADAALAAPGDMLIEIGPGKGALTRIFAERGEPFSAIEIDTLMVSHLSAMPDVARICKIINADFMELDLQSLLPPDGEVKFAGNLPYDVGTAMVQRVLDFPRFSSAVFMLQLEVVERIVAKPGTGKYGLLALSVQSRATPKLLFKVGKGNFRPVPAVDSAVVELRRLENPLFRDETHQKTFFKVSRAAFAHRRKTILNSLSMSLCTAKSELQPVLEKTGIDPLCRPETLPLEKFLELSSQSFFHDKRP